MEIEGLDYNTQRERLVLPEYGREIQKMVDHAVALPQKADRQRCAEEIVAVMARMVPQGKGGAGYQQKLWDHLALMSHFKLDIDYPYDVSQAAQMAAKPAPLAYPMQPIPVRHYGLLLFQLFERLKTMPAGRQRDVLARHAANQMKRSLMQWGHGAAANEKVIADLEQYTDGVIKLDAKTFKFEKINEREFSENRRKKK